MLQLIDTLYHGTSEKFETIDVLKGRNNKDFGKGFYMAVTKKTGNRYDAQEIP